MGHLELYHIYVFVVVIVCWFVFAAAFLSRKRTPVSVVRKRDNSSFAGFAIQIIGFAFVWMLRRQLFTHIVEFPVAIEIAIAIYAIILAMASTIFLISSIRTLGKQWSVAAQTVERHELITNGPYGVVRHPIYSGLLGMLIATGLSMSRWEGLAAGIVLYTVGTFMRIRGEERLMREAFGKEFEQYTQRVPSFIPFLHF